MKPKFIILIIALLFIVSALFFFNKRGSGPTAEDRSQLTNAEIVKSPNSTGPEVYTSLRDMAKNNDLEALELAIDKSADSRRIVREGAAKALSYFDNEQANAKLQILLNDPEPNVRIRTLQALSEQPSELRLQLILNHLDRKDLTLKEFLVTQTAIIVANPNRGAKSNARDQIISFIKDEKNDTELKKFAFSKLLEVSPQNESVLDFARNSLLGQNGQETQLLSIRHLSVLKDQTLKRLLPRLKNSSDPKILDAAKTAESKY